MALRRRFSLALAGFGLEFESDRPGIISVLSRRYAPFSGKAGEAAKTQRLTCSEGPARQRAHRPELAWSGKKLELWRGDFRASLDVGTGEGELEAAPNEQCLDAFLRTLLSALLARSGGLMLHSAGLLRDGRAWLFPGVSGAGKSTLSRLAAGAGAEVVSDEINLLRFEKGRPVLYGSPFWGEMRAEGRPGRWALAGICLPRKAAAHVMQDCPSGEAFRALMRCSVNFSRERAAGLAAMAAADSLLKAVQVRKLGFSKQDAGFLGFLR